MTVGATFRAVRGGIARRRLQTTVVALVVLIATASTVVAAALVVNSDAPFDHAFATQRGADIVATIDPTVAASNLARSAHISGVTAAAGPYPEVTVAGTSAGIRFGPQSLVGRVTPRGPVDDLVIENGRWATKPGQVVLATGDNSGLGFSVGSTMSVGTGAHRQTLIVVGLANSITGSASGWVVPAEIPLLRAAGGASATQMLYRFADAGIGAPLHADVTRLTSALPRGALLGTTSYYAAKIEEDGNIAPFVPFLLAFGILGIVMSVLIVANVVGGAVASGYRRIGILKSIGFTPTQIAGAYAAQVALPALVGCLLGLLLGNLLATPLLRQNASVYGVGRLGVPIWVDVAVPVGICVLAAVAALLPALRAGRLSTVQAITIGRAPQAGRGYAAHRLLGRLPLPRPVTIGLAAHFARPSRTFLTFAAVLLGATAVTFGVGLASSLQRLLDGISHQRAQPVQISLPGNGFDGGPQQVKIGPKHVNARRPGFGPGAPQVPTGSAEHAILAAVHTQPGTLHVVAQADDSVSVAGLSQQIPVTAFRGAAAWTGYDLVSGHWYTGPDQVLAPTGFLTQTGTSVGDLISIAEGHKTRRVRIVGEIFDTHNRGLNLVMSWATLHALHPGAVPDQIDVGLRPGTSARGYANSVSRRLGPDYAVELNARGPAVVQAMIGLIGTLALLLAAVAALGVLNTVVLNTRERVHDLGVFKAVGMTPRQTIAMAIAWVAGIGLIAGVIAVPLGIAMHDEILPAMAGSVGLRLPASFLNVYGGSELTLLALVGVLIAIAGAIAPAAWAAKIRTATALHTE
jgi:putative ABC transport system permease protein